MAGGGELEIRVEGLGAALAALAPAEIAGQPTREFLRASGAAIEFHARDNTRPNRFTGDVLAGFRTVLEDGPIPTGVTVENTSEHAFYLEKGTRPHFPPLAAITPWAEAKGIAPYALALSISRYGTLAHPFLAPALEQSAGEIDGLLAVAAKEIERQAALR